MSGDSTQAPPSKFRVIAWRGAERHFAVIGDVDTLLDARTRADALFASGEVMNASVFNDTARCVYNARLGGDPLGHYRRPTAVTKLAGFTDPTDQPKRGDYKRR